MQSRAIYLSACSLAALTLGGCSDTPEDTSTPLAKGAACLQSVAEKPCSLLTPDLARSVFPLVPQDIETNELVSKHSASCTVGWAAGRKTKVGNGSYTMEVDVNDTVTLSNIRPTTATSFEQRHRTMTDAQKADAAKRAQAAIAAKTEDGAIDKKHEQKGKDFAASLINRTEWEPIDGVGDQAAWGGIGRFKTLDVQLGESMFSIRAEVSNDESRVLEASKLAAQAIINACD